jgi:hypothetical protein
MFDIFISDDLQTYCHKNTYTKQLHTTLPLFMPTTTIYYKADDRSAMHFQKERQKKKRLANYLPRIFSSVGFVWAAGAPLRS